MEKLRSEGKSFREIAERIGAVSKGQVQKKFRELHGHDGRRANPPKMTPWPWTDKDLQTLKDGYANGDNVEDIIARLDDKRSMDTIYVKASKLGITNSRNDQNKAPAQKSTKPKAAGSRNSAADNSAPCPELQHDVIEIEKVGVFVLSGITPSEAATLEGVSTDHMRAAYQRLGWQEVRIAPNSRISTRTAILEEARKLAGEDFDMSNPSHLMIVLSLAADQTQRNLAETARITLLPLAWVERVFGRLDAEGVWPVTDRTREDLTASDYQRFAEVCEQEMFMLDRILAGHLHQAA